MTNPDNVGGLPELPEPAAFMKRPSAQNSYNREEPYFTASQMRAYGELCRAAPAGGDVECFVREMRTSKGSEFFVVVKRDGRELTPHMYTERWKAEYDVASWQHLLCGAPKPDILAYGPSEDSAPAGSWGVDLEEFREAVDLLRITSLGGKRDCERHGTFPHDFDRSLAKADRLLALIDSHAALLRKLQQGADYVMVPREPTEAMMNAGYNEVDYDENSDWDNVRNTYLAMIAASQDQDGGE